MSFQVTCDKASLVKVWDDCWLFGLADQSLPVICFSMWLGRFGLLVR